MSKPTKIIATDFDGALGPNPFIADKQLIVDYSIEEKIDGWTRMQPFPNAVDIINGFMNQSIVVVIVTGREERFRHISEAWLKLYGFNYSQLIMIPKAWQSYTQYTQFKMGIIKSLYPAVVIDDDFDLLIAIRQTIGIKGHLITRNEDWDLQKISILLEGE